MTRGQERPAVELTARRERSAQGRWPATVLVRLTHEERDALAERAASQGTSIQRYLLECAAAVEAGAAALETVAQRQQFASELLGVRRLLVNIANNVNQLAKPTNGGGDPSSQAAATATFDAARRASVRLFQLVDSMLPPSR